jgi:hypothetical protein
MDDWGFHVSLAVFHIILILSPYTILPVGYLISLLSIQFGLTVWSIWGGGGDITSEDVMIMNSVFLSIF